MDDWESGEKPTAEKMNANIRDVGNFHKNKPTAKVSRKLTAQTLTTNTTIVFDQVNVDNDDMVDLGVSTTQITIRTAGYYLVVGTLIWAEPAAGLGYYRQGKILKNGALVTNDIRGPIGNSTAQGLTFAALPYCNVGDLLTLHMLHNATTSLTSLISDVDGCCSLLATWNNG
ncbi:hypothetical protein F4560_004419 [Saccharothrix ecbatanensis]|uniref:C1q domain-containing protein n=1 Tax=Saccharothrix ecbatanensis TaxID=1105145 RepID=A0A7W9HMD0_9PSEU|nr:hypothetical protein [Saccharothrix ecbatanensis]MBB5804651.1 hypothetical protein [Saccharothrix ecbatanensis]